MAKLSYRDIAAVLRDRIQSGRHQRGDLLPAQPQLAAEFGATVPTVNNALRILRSEGLISTHQGKGTVVIAMTPKITRNAMLRYQKTHRERAVGAFSQEVKALGMTPRSDLVVARVTPPREVAEILGVPEGEEVVTRRRHMFADDVPVQIAPSYIPLDIAAGTVLEEHEQGPGGMLSRMAELGYRQTRMHERITSRPPTEDEATFLEISVDQRVYVITHVGYAEERPVEVCLHVMPTHYWELEYDWTVDPE